MPETFRDAEQKSLARFVSNLDQDVFALVNLPEEVVAVLFAYYSRSRRSLRRNLLELLEADGAAVSEDPSRVSLASAESRARSFHEKWVVGYGHASVAEHGVAHLAVENVSILVSKLIEDARLASFTEKSTRYVTFDRSRYHRPAAIMASRLRDRYVQTLDALFDAYAAFSGPVRDHLEARFPKAPGVSERAYRASLHAKTCDVLRYLLPAATLTNLGLTANARTLAHLISKLSSHPLEEARRIGGALRQEGETVLPTLVRHAAYNPYLAGTPPAVEALANDCVPEMDVGAGPAVSLVRYDPDGETELAAAILYPQMQVSLESIRRKVRALPASRVARIIDTALQHRGPHDAPPRALEHISYTFDLLVDFGAYRDIPRHRLVSQEPQQLSVAHGYDAPGLLDDCGLMGRFEDSMARAADLYYELARSFPEEAAYAVPLAYRRRVVFTMNLRELFHFVELRSSLQGHSSYRRIAQEMYRRVAEVHPAVARYMRVVMEDADLERLAAERRLDRVRTASAGRTDAT